MSSETTKIPGSSPKVDDLRLSNANLDRVPDAISCPAYDRSSVTPDLYGRTNFYERAIVDVILRSKGHVKSRIW